MADTPKSVADLIAGLPSTPGGCSAQSLRDLVVSALGIYGSISVLDGSTQQDNPDTGAKLTCFAANGSASGVTPDHTDDSLTVLVAGVYDVNMSVSFSGSGTRTFKFRLRVNGIESIYGCTRKLGTGGDVGAAGFHAPGVTLAANDVVTVYVEADNSTADLTVVDAALSARMVG